MLAWRGSRWALEGSALVSIVAVCLGCSGGSDPVVTSGGYGESPGPGQTPFPGLGGDSRTSVSVSAIEALCLDACANVNAAGCKASPFAQGCDPLCSGAATQFPGQCADEAAVAFACIADAKVSCVNDVPTYSGCDDEAKDLQECQTPGSTGDCVRTPGGDAGCTSVGAPPMYWVCAGGTPPSMSCVPLGETSFCCP